MPTYKSLEFLGYPKYRVGDDGSVWSYRSMDVKGQGRIWRWRPIKATPGTWGHLIVSLCRDGKVTNYFIHRLVLLAFVGPCPPGMMARHFPDRDPTNNSLGNLSWATALVNQRDRDIHDTHNRGRANTWTSKLTHPQVRKARKLKAGGWTYKQIANFFKISYHLAYMVASGRSYTAVK